MFNASFKRQQLSHEQLAAQQAFEGERRNTDQSDRVIDKFRLCGRTGLADSSIYAARSFDETLISSDRSSIDEHQQSYKRSIDEIDAIFDFYKYCIEQRRDELMKEVLQTYADTQFNEPSMVLMKHNPNGFPLKDSQIRDNLLHHHFKPPDLHLIQSFIKSNFGNIEHQKPTYPAIRRFTRESFSRSGSYGSPLQTSTDSHAIINCPRRELQSSMESPLLNQYDQTTSGNSSRSSDSKGIKKFQVRPGLRRQRIMYHFKFGQFGNQPGEFTEPSGIAVNDNDDIIVADTNNHRIQVFDKEGSFLFQFGECGKRDGQLLYPNRVAVNKLSGDIIITERSPTHQVQIFSREGVFKRKFGSDVLQHPRGVCVDYHGHIIVVECKVMRVFIFDMLGNIHYRFTCGKLVEFPNAIAVNSKNEIFISDNRSHCVKVFSYNGSLIRVIGDEGLTNFPIAVGIESDNDEDVLVADNHNSFNLTMFRSDGVLKKAFESKVRHTQCFDAAIMSNGNIALSSKDYHVYIYRYKDDDNQ